jgi:hypothetical protein
MAESDDAVGEWLRGLKLESYLDTFRERGIDTTVRSFEDSPSKGESVKTKERERERERERKRKRDPSRARALCVYR